MVAGNFTKKRRRSAAAGFESDTPLWYYILKEAAVLAGGVHLGPVGSTIVAEVFVALLRTDPSGYYAVDPAWTPTLPSLVGGQFTMSDMFRYLPQVAVNPNGGDQGAL